MMKISESTQIIELPENPKQLATPESSFQIVYSQESSNNKRDKPESSTAMEQEDNKKYSDVIEESNRFQNIDNFALTRSVTPLQSLIVVKDTSTINKNNIRTNKTMQKDIATLNDIFDIQKKPALQRHLNSLNHVKDLRNSHNPKKNVNDTKNAHEGRTVEGKVKKEQILRAKKEDTTKKTINSRSHRKAQNSKSVVKKVKQEKLNVTTRNMNKMQQENQHAFVKIDQNSNLVSNSDIFADNTNLRLKEISREDLPQATKGIKQEQKNQLLQDDTTATDQQLINFSLEKSRFTYSLQQQLHETVMEHQLQLNRKLTRINDNISETIIKINKNHQIKLLNLQNELQNELDELKLNIKDSLEDF